VSGTDADGNASSRNFSAVRFGVGNTESTDPAVVGISSAGGPYDLNYSSSYGGSWQIMGLSNSDGDNTYYIHVGPSSPTIAFGATGCIEICGPGAMNSFNSYIQSLGGNPTVTFQSAAVPPLVVGGYVK